MPHPYSGEPALEEIFADPIVQTLMRIDGLAEADLRRTLLQAGARQGYPERAADVA